MNNNKKAVINYKHNNLLVFILLSLFSINFFGISNYILVTAFIILLIKNNLRISLNADFIILLFFGITYFAFYPSIKTNLLLSIMGLMCSISFLIGFNLYKNITILNIKNIIYMLSIFMALHGLLNLFYNQQLGLINSSLKYDFWTKKISAATGQAINFALLACLLFFVLFLERKKYIRILFIIIAAISLYYNLMLGGRTFIFLCILSIALGYILFVVLSKKTIKNINKSLLIIGTICLISVIGIYLYSRNIGGIKDTIESSYFYHRFFSVQNKSTDIFSSGRFEIKLKYYENFFKYMWGGNKLRILIGQYAHELWLDIYSDSGILPFIFIWIYSIKTLKRCILILKQKILDYKYKILIFTFYIIIMAQFFVEPVLQGAPQLLFSFIIIDGMIAQYLEQSNKVNRVEDNESNIHF